MTIHHIRKAILLFVLLAFVAGLAGCAASLGSAAREGDIKEMERLISAGANVNARNAYGLTPLHSAALYGKVEAARLLIRNGADVNAIDSNGKTPLHFAAFYDQGEVARLLIENGANIEDALAVAKKRGNAAIINLVEEAEALKVRHTGITSSPQPSNTTGNIVHNSVAQTAPKLSPKEYIPRPAVKEIAVEDIHTIPVFKAQQRDNDFAVVIGVEEYKDIKTKSDFSRSDAGLMKDYLKALGFKERNIQFIIDGDATRSGIEKSIEAWLPNRVKKGSIVFVYYSGHGAPDVAKGDGYIVPYDGDPNYLEQTGYSLKRLTEHLAKLDAKEVIVLLDSCFSGAGGRSVLAKGARPLVMKTETLALRDNIVMVTATRAEQISMSSPEKGHGLFTYHFLKALKDGKKNLSDIYGQLKPLVENEAKELNAEQSPSMTPAPEAVKGRFVLVR